jgi:hypothetical protein
MPDSARFGVEFAHQAIPDTRGGKMLKTLARSVIKPRYPRRYVGRHRGRYGAPIAIRFLFTLPTPRRVD